MEIKTRKESDILFIRISGDLDASNSIQIDEIIGNAVSSDEKKLLIDCKDLNYISSAGLGVFMSYLQEFEKKKIALIFFSMSEKVRNVFQILGLDKLVNIVNSKENARTIVH